MFLLASDSSSPVDEDDHQPSSINTTVTRRDDERLVSAFALRDNDVLFGRGSGPNGFAGNVRYRNMIRSILIKAFDFHNHDDNDGDASVVDGDHHSEDAALEFVVFPDNVKDMSLARRHRILATQVVKAIKSRHGRFLQRLPGAPTSSQQRKQRRGRASGALDHDDISLQPRIERRLYQVVEDSIAIEKTKQNFRDQMRLLEIEHGIRQAPTTSSSTAGSSSREEHDQPHHRSRALSPSQANIPITVSSSSVKRKRIEDDYCSLSSESLNVMKKRTREGFSLMSSSHKDLEEMYHYNNHLLGKPSTRAIPLPITRTTTANLFHSLTPSSLTCDPYQNDFIIMERGGVPLSRVAESLPSRIVTLSREQERSLPLGHHHHHPSPTTQPCMLLPEARQLVGYNSSPRPLIVGPADLRTRMKSNMMIHTHHTFVDKAQDHHLQLRRHPHHSPNNLLSLDQSRTRMKRRLDHPHDTSLISRRLVATALPNTMSMRNTRSNKNNNSHNNHHYLLEEPARPIMTTEATSATRERVEAMIASHQTRRDRFWMGWAQLSNARPKHLQDFGH